MSLKLKLKVELVVLLHWLDMEKVWMKGRRASPEVVLL